MLSRLSFIVPLALLIVAGLAFDFLQRRISGPLMAVNLHPDVVAQLEESLADQRQLARLDPEQESSYRERFAEVQTLVQRLHVLEMSREAIVQRYERILLGSFIAAAAFLAGGLAWRQRRQERKLTFVQSALKDLAGGRTDIRMSFKGRDTLGRIAGMIEETSRRMAHDQRRLRALQNLSSWQEAARRHAHEMKTPLTGARLELERLDTLLVGPKPPEADDIRQATASARDELERLGQFAKQFTSFARLPQPKLESQDMGALLGEFVQTFQEAWSNLTLTLEEPAEKVHARADRDMLRQVLVNLADNASLAIKARGAEPSTGRLTYSLANEGEMTALRVTDNGPGIAEDILPRLFEPYTTTRKVGEGMGLGLAICRKIALDHGGDLEVEKTSDDGTVFRLTLPNAARYDTNADTEDDAGEVT